MPGMPNKRKVSQDALMTKHSEHHSDKHMQMMRDLMAEGMTFEQAHVAALKKVDR